MRKTHNKSKTDAYKVWRSMKQRCSNPKHVGYKYYGGRGITICNEWQSFEGFYKSMGDRPEGLTIERIDNDGNYEPDNCKWATMKEQANNRSERDYYEHLYHCEPVPYYCNFD